MGKTKKMLRTIKRRETLEEAVKFSLASCDHHGYTLDADDLWKHRCYMGNHGKSYCQYVRVIEK